MVRSGRDGTVRIITPLTNGKDSCRTPPAGGPAAVKMFEPINKPDSGKASITSISTQDEGKGGTPAWSPKDLRTPSQGAATLGHPTLLYRYCIVNNIDPLESRETKNETFGKGSPDLEAGVRYFATQ